MSGRCAGGRDDCLSARQETILEENPDSCILFCDAQKRRKFKVGLVQMACGPDPRQNLRRAIAGIREAARQGAAMVCLPELFRSRYFCQREDASAL